jgi:hypothetical protein
MARPFRRGLSSPPRCALTVEPAPEAREVERTQVEGAVAEQPAQSPDPALNSGGFSHVKVSEDLAGEPGA